MGMPARSLRPALTVALALALPTFAGVADAGAQPLLAGAATADITPPITSPMFAYTARSFVFGPDADLVTGRGNQIVFDPDTGYYAKTFRASDGIHTRVLSRALVFQRDGERYAMVQADLGGLPYALTQEVQKRIADTGITADHLLCRPRTRTPRRARSGRPTTTATRSSAATRSTRASSSSRPPVSPTRSTTR